MKIIDKLPYIIIAGFAWIVIISSCANQGMPTGGPRDTIPPVLLSTQPEFKALNYNGDEVHFTFDEFIIPDEISEKLVISPPLEKRPTIRTKSKTLIIQFNEKLLDSVTYSMDFKNSIVDNNEKNAYENLRFSFSTGNIYDSLRVAGMVMNAFNKEPVENALVMLHKNLHDSAVYTLRPNYIAKTDEDGIYLIDNIAEGEYHLFAINDDNSDLMYNEGAEKIAFYDTLVVPSAEFFSEADTLTNGNDSLLVSGHTHFLPEPVYLNQFTEDIYQQYLSTSNRDSKYKCTFVFNETVKDTFDIQLVNANATEEDWYTMEPNEEYDSLTVWIADTTVAKMDTLNIELSYFQIDSTNQLYLHKDTVELNFSEKEKEESVRRGRRAAADDDEEEAPAPLPQFNWATNLSASTFELDDDVVIQAPEPVKDFDYSRVKLFHTEDTLKTPLEFRFDRDSTAWRTYRLSFPWEPETNYTLEIDSAACENIYGITSRELSSKFKTREEDYYGIINLNVTGVDSTVIIQLLENNDEEEVLAQQTIEKDQSVVFDFLAPEKYKVKAIFDNNKNGKWDTGSYQDKYQPEMVVYINEVIKVRSNWDSNINWELTKDPYFEKNIRDRELEEKLQKEAEEEERREREQREEPGQQQNNMFQP